MNFMECASSIEPSKALNQVESENQMCRFNLGYISIDPFVPNALFLYPVKISENREVH